MSIEKKIKKCLEGKKDYARSGIFGSCYCSLHKESDDVKRLCPFAGEFNFNALYYGEPFHLIVEKDVYKCLRYPIEVYSEDEY